MVIKVLTPESLNYEKPIHTDAHEAGHPKHAETYIAKQKAKEMKIKLIGFCR